MPNVTGGKGSFGGSARAGRNASNMGMGGSGAGSNNKAGNAGGVKSRNVVISGPNKNVFKDPESGLETSWGSRIHTSLSDNPVSRGISIAAGPEMHNKNVQRANLYNEAARKWNASAQTPSFNNFVNNIAPLGLSMQPPDIKRPSTFSDGDYHLGWNPGATLGLAGAMIPGAGALTGSLGQAAWTAMGLPNVMLGGSGSMGMPTWNNSFGSKMSPVSPMASTSALSQPNPMDRTAPGIPLLSMLNKQPTRLGAMM